MQFTDSHYIQLVAALIAGGLLYAAVYMLPEKVTLGTLILMIPFQIVDSRYGSLNMVLTYLITIAFTFQRKITLFPLLIPILLIVVAYLISLSNTPAPDWPDHIIYLVAIFTNFAMFYLVYNHLRREKDWSFFFNMLTTLNVLIIGYGGIQLWAGQSGGVAMFGIEEFQMNTNRDDARLVGPFKATAVMVEYLSLQSLVLAYLILHSIKTSPKLFYVALLIMNSFFMVASGNRGGFVTFILAGITFLFAYRRELGPGRLIMAGVVATVLFSLASVVVVKYTEFNVLFDRLGETEVEGALPDTRSNTWPLAWSKIKENPITGQGPRFYAGKEKFLHTITYPHSLYLFLPLTVGIIGLVAYVFLFGSIVRNFLVSTGLQSDDAFLRGIPRMGLLVMLVFLISEGRIEFLRFKLVDYQNYVFIVLAALLALNDRLRIQAGK